MKLEFKYLKLESCRNQALSDSTGDETEAEESTDHLANQKFKKCCLCSNKTKRKHCFYHPPRHYLKIETQILIFCISIYTHMYLQFKI